MLSVCCQRYSCVSNICENHIRVVSDPGRRHVVAGWNYIRHSSCTRENALCSANDKPVRHEVGTHSTNYPRWNRACNTPFHRQLNVILHGMPNFHFLQIKPVKCLANFLETANVSEGMVIESHALLACLSLPIQGAEFLSKFRAERRENSRKGVVLHAPSPNPNPSIARNQQCLPPQGKWSWKRVRRPAISAMMLNNGEQVAGRGE